MAFALRRLGAADFGVFALALSILTSLSFIDLALSFAVVRASAIDRVARTAGSQRAARADIRAAHAAYVGLAAIITFATFGLAGFFPRAFQATNASDFEVRTTLVLVGLSFAVMIGTNSLYGIAYGREQFALIAAAAAAGAVANISVVIFAIEPLRMQALGLGQVAAILVNRALIRTFLRRAVPWFTLKPTLPAWHELRSVITFAFPLLIASIANQFLVSIDLMVIGALTSAASVGFYRVGSILPQQGVAVIYQGYDVVFPSLASTPDLTSQLRVTALLTRIASYVASVGFGILAFFRNDIVLLVVGRPADLASNVLLIFCVLWSINVTGHGLALLVVARRRHGIIGQIAALEIAVNVPLTVVLVLLLGPVGAALGSLVAITVSTCVLLPFKVSRELQRPVGRLMVRYGLVPVLLGLAAIGVPSLLAVATLPPSLGRLLVGGLSGLAVAAVSGIVLLREEGRRQLLALFGRLTGETDDTEHVTFPEL